MEAMKGPAVCPRPFVVACRGQCSHVGGEQAYRRSYGPGVGLRLGHAGTRLHVGVQRNGDRGQDADDCNHDHQLDQREAGLATLAGPPLVVD